MTELGIEPTVPTLTHLSQGPRLTVEHLLRAGGTAQQSTFSAVGGVAPSVLAKTLATLGDANIDRRPVEREPATRGRPATEVFLRLGSGDLPDKQGAQGDNGTANTWPHAVGVAPVPELCRVWWCRADMTGRRVASGDIEWPADQQTASGFVDAVQRCIDLAHQVVLQADEEGTSAPGQDNKPSLSRPTEYLLGVGLYGQVGPVRPGSEDGAVKHPLYREFRGEDVLKLLQQGLRQNADVPEWKRLLVAVDNEVRALGTYLALSPGEHLARGVVPEHGLTILKVVFGAGAAIVDKQGIPHRGAHSLAGEVGHLRIEDGDQALDCRCLRRGHFESLVKPGALARMLNRLAPGVARSEHSAGDQQRIALDDSIVRLADETADEDALAVVRRLGRGLGRVLALLDVTIDPSQVILYLRPGLYDSDVLDIAMGDERRQAGYNTEVLAPIRKVRYEHDLGAVAAAALAVQRFLQQPQLLLRVGSPDRHA